VDAEQLPPSAKDTVAKELRKKARLKAKSKRDILILSLLQGFRENERAQSVV